MDSIAENPGFQHLVENVFANLDHKSLLECQKVNSTWKSILNNPKFWFKKCLSKGLLRQHQNNWTKLFKSLTNTELEKILTKYLMKIHNGLPIQSPLKLALRESIISDQNGGHIEIIKILAPSADDLNEPFPSGKTPYQYALHHKSIELIKILAPTLKNPNAPDSKGIIPICSAVELGHNEIVEILAPLVKNPNESHAICTTICLAADRGNIEAVKILAPLVENPNVCGFGCTPICKAAKQGNIEIVKVLAPFVDDPNKCGVQTTCRNMISILQAL